MSEFPAVRKNRTLRRRALRATLVTPLLIGVLLFGAAGRIDLPWLWLYLAAIGGSSAASLGLLDPGLIQERIRPGGRFPGLVGILGTGLSTAHWVVAGLDVGRFHWSDGVPPSVHVLGLVGMCASLALTVWAMRLNPFFSSVVRIQRERQHRLITSGPYRFVRHPGYAAGLVLVVASPLALGSGWSALPALPAIPFLFRRVLVEERLLGHEFEEHARYAARVRYRLLPGLW